MFKEKIKVLNLNWEVLFMYKSKFKPKSGEFIYYNENNSYYIVKTVIHNIFNNKGETIVIATPINNIRPDEK